MKRPLLCGRPLASRQPLRTCVLLLALFLIAPPLSHAGAQEPSASNGERIYDKRCSNCHGDDLQNNSGIAFDLRRLKADEHARFIDSVLHGKRAMPSWQGALTMEQIEDLWVYVRTHAYQQ
jgi:mono/diheme cytochrome c family protein